MKKSIFDKSQRLCSKKNIDLLFGHSSSFALYPIRIVYRIEKAEQDTKKLPVQLLLSVSKRHFKRAVKRNRVKRQLREAFRKNNSALRTMAASQSLSVKMAILWLSDELYPSENIQEKVYSALQKIERTLQEMTTNTPQNQNIPEQIDI